LLAGLLLEAMLAPWPLSAQTNTAKTAAPANRCLLIVDTSRSMQRRADAALKAVQDLLTSGLSGQLRTGDTVGVWTFNDDLYAGRFPLQTWSPQAQADITSRTLTFLKAQQYGKQANFDKVLPALGRVIKDSRLLTVILVSSGDEKLRGTPFDDRINALYKQGHDEQQKARMPFVTVLRASNGQLADYTVSTPPWPTQMPPLPQETQSAETIQSKLFEALHNAPSAAATPLTSSGKKTQPATAPPPTPQPAVVALGAPPSAPVVPSTQQSIATQPPKPTPPPVQIAKTEPALARPDKPPTAIAPPPSPAPMPVTAPKAEPVTVPATQPVAPAPARAEAVLAPPTPAPRPTTVAVEPPNPSPTAEVKQAPPPEPANQLKPETAKAPGTQPPQAVSVPPQVAPNLPASQLKAITAASEPPKVSVAVEPKLAPASVKPPPSSKPAPPGQTATAVPAEALARHRNVWIAGLILIGVVGAFTLLLLRRARAAPRVSLITRSFERKNKP